MGSTRSARLVLVILVALLVAAVGHPAYADNGMFLPLEPQREQSIPACQKEAAAKSAERAAPNESNPGPKPVDWDNLIPGVRAALKEGFPGEDIERRSRISIYREYDVTGDGVSEALVYTGDGGAYTRYMALVRIEDGKPVVALFETPDGKVGPYLFLAGASARHGVTTEVLTDKRAIYLGCYETSDTGPGFNSCSATAYRWNAEAKTFDWDRDLSNEITKTYCERAAKALPQH